MPLDVMQMVPWLALLVSSGGLLYTIQRGRQSTDEGLRAKVEAEVASLRQRIEAEATAWRQRMEIQHEEFVILKARIGPLLTVLDTRLAAMFHHDADEFGLDGLIERYEADPTDTKSSITEEELTRLIRHMHMWYERVKKDGPAPNQSEELASSLWWVLLRGLRDVRQILREREVREASDQRQRDEITAYLEAAKAAFVQRESWWTRLRNYLAGFNSS